MHACQLVNVACYFGHNSYQAAIFLAVYDLYQWSNALDYMRTVMGRDQGHQCCEHFYCAGALSPKYSWYLDLSTETAFSLFGQQNIVAASFASFSEPHARLDLHYLVAASGNNSRLPWLVLTQ